MKKVISRGFTLIELLVVIAIIGILASIVLVSLNSARNKGKDTRVLSDVNQIRTQLEADLTNGVYSDLYNAAAGTGLAASYTTNGPGNGATGGTASQVQGNMGTLNGDANTNGGAYPVIYINSTSAGVVGGPGTASMYAIYGKTSTGYYCVDSTGNNKTNTGAIPAAGSNICQ